MMSSLVVTPPPPCFRSIADSDKRRAADGDETWLDEPERQSAGVGGRCSASNEAYASIVGDGRAMISHQRLDPDRIEPPAGKDEASGGGASRPRQND